MSHRHAGFEPGELECVEIDPHVCLQPINGGGDGISRRDEATGELVPVPEYFAGFILGHDREGLEVRCEGFVGVSEHHGNRWEMTGSLEGGDLTLSPSILCRLGSASGEPCGFHGFVRDGRWVSA